MKEGEKIFLDTTLVPIENKGIKKFGSTKENETDEMSDEQAE